MAESRRGAMVVLPGLLALEAYSPFEAVLPE